MATKVLLGLVDEKIKQVNQIEQCSWTDNKIGGCPIFSPTFGAKKHLFKSGKLICKKCSKNLAFIFQINCPISDSKNDRVIYLFLCVNPACDDQQFRLIRVISKSIEQTDDQNDQLMQDDWTDSGAGQSDALAENLSDMLNLEETEEIDLQIYSYFKPSYLCVIDEPKESAIDRKKYEAMAYGTLSEEASGTINEMYEKKYPDAFQNDRINYKFYKQLLICPEQIVRYEWSGVPLRPSNQLHWNIDNCHGCGSKRDFEFQLMPSIINYLYQHKMDHVGDINIDFETMLAFTCYQNCSNPHSDFSVFDEQMILFRENFATN